MGASDDEVTTRQCPACRQTVPAAQFCGSCGADAAAPVDALRTLLRPNVYATAHRETVWTPRVSSTYLPRVPGRMRRPFRLGMILVLIVIVALAAMRSGGPLGVTVATIGWPLLFFIYVWQTDVVRDLPVRILVAAMVLGVALGVGWWLLAATWLANAYDVSTGSAHMLADVLDVGFLITAGGAVLLVVPAVVTRVFPVPVRESLDGFVVGAFGALWYLTASTATIVGPQFAEGLIEDQTLGRMVSDAITHGVVAPIVTIAGGGLVGMSLWFRPNRAPGRNPKRARRALTLCTVAGAPLYLAVWTIDAAVESRWLIVAIRLALAVLALILVRCAVQIALLNEEPDPATGEPVLCVHCEKVVPDMPFCSACGAAARASSRTSRRRRRESPPVRQDTAAVP